MINSHLKNFIRVIIKQGKPLIMCQEYYLFCSHSMFVRVYILFDLKSKPELIGKQITEKENRDVLIITKAVFEVLHPF